MTIELLNERLEVLQKQLQEKQTYIEQFMADANAIHGAIQELMYWINNTENLEK